MGDDNKINLIVSFGTTFLVFLGIITIWKRNEQVQVIATYDLMIASLIGFGVGLVVAFIMRLLGKKTDYNLTALFLPSFFVLIYLFLGNVPFGEIYVLDLVFYFTIASLLSIAMGFFKFVL